MEIVLVGLNHRTAPVEVRERLSFTAEQARQAAEQLRSRGILEETLVLSTCNRSEVYGVPPETSHECAPGLSSFLSEFHSVRPDVLGESLYHHYDCEAVRHLFRVSAGLDSMLLGEAEILGQVREAYRIAHELGATGPVLNRLFQGALEVGKRVRTETDLGTRPMSVASAGVKLAERIFGKLSERSALVLGAGAISEQVVAQLRARGIARLFMMNRSRERADELARQYEGKVIGWAEWKTALKVPDVVVSSVSSDEPVLRRDTLEKAMAARGNRALLLMDLGVPRNIEASAANLYNVYVYNVDDLSDIVQQNRQAAADVVDVGCRDATEGDWPPVRPRVLPCATATRTATLRPRPIPLPVQRFTSPWNRSSPRQRNLRCDPGRKERRSPRQTRRSLPPAHREKNLHRLGARPLAKCQRSHRVGHRP